jgi:hypothetical protein
VPGKNPPAFSQGKKAGKGAGKLLQGAAGKVSSPHGAREKHIAHEHRLSSLPKEGHGARGMAGKVPDQEFLFAQREAVPVRKGTIERRRGAAHGPKRGFLLRVIKNWCARLGPENLGIVRVIKMPVGEKDVANFRLGKGELQGGGGAAGIDEGSFSLI